MHACAACSQFEKSRLNKLKVSALVGNRYECVASGTASHAVARMRAVAVVAASVLVKHEDGVRVMHEDTPLAANALTHVGWRVFRGAKAAS